MSAGPAPPSASPPRRFPGRLALALFFFLLSVTILVGRREFFHSDGLVAHRVAEAIWHRGAIDLPPELARNARYAPGVGGRSYSVFGIGYPLYLAPAVGADSLLSRLAGDGPRVEGAGPPGFFATNSLAPVHALTGVVLLALLLELGVGPVAALVATLAATLGSMAIVYATINYDMPLANLLVLAGMLFVLRACSGGRAADGGLAGAFLGAALLVRITSVIFVPVLALHVLWVAHRGGPGWLRRTVRVFARGALLLALAGVVVVWHNQRRFGAPFATGYTNANAAYAFNASLAESIPTLLASPNRSIFVYAPLLLVALSGIPALLRRRRVEGATLLAMALVNFLFFAKNRNWATAAQTWGPRFQLLTTLLLTLPLAFRFEADRPGRGRPRLRAALWASALGGAFLLQVLVLGAWQVSGPTRHWLAGESQLALALGRLRLLVGEGRWGELMFWWAGPWLGLGPLRVVLAGALVTAVASGWLLVRELRRHRSGG